mgnify:CR=1 FL=1
MYGYLKCFLLRTDDKSENIEVCCEENTYRSYPYKYGIPFSL